MSLPYSAVQELSQRRPWRPLVTSQNPQKLCTITERLKWEGIHKDQSPAPRRNQTTKSIAQTLLALRGNPCSKDCISKREVPRFSHHVHFPDHHKKKNIKVLQENFHTALMFREEPEKVDNAPLRNV